MIKFNNYYYYYSSSVRIINNETQKKKVTHVSVRAGMRRPSWNKSQAIQQVISLKALLEPCDDDDVSATHNLRRRVVPPQSQPGHVSTSLSLSLSLTLLLILIFDISLPLKKKLVVLFICF